MPFDLTTLQRECNKYFGYSAKQTLDYTQSLYEKKLITYPRTDSRCLTEGMIVSTVNNILGKNDFDTERIKVVFNSKKVTDHHAIILTISSVKEDVSELPLSRQKQLQSGKWNYLILLRVNPLRKNCCFMVFICLSGTLKIG